ncbi:hypothetical protein E3N88_38294 [Mikania micrantha]|uniref:Uncharacterized protein n=1 Tax=Mikania micrantha TaxID=192012 RepID=A0A5N6LTN1_9ASTR|nr:hypothetical protein E3N88_38294 [Mikania micrantha]
MPNKQGTQILWAGSCGFHGYTRDKLTLMRQETLEQKDAWKTELKNLSNKNGYDMNRNGDSGPLLLDVLEGYLKVESQSQVRSGGRRLVTPDQDTLTNFDSRNRRSSSSSVIGGLPPLGRYRRGGSSNSGYKKDDYNRRYDNDDIADDIMLRASAALENLQLDRKTRMEGMAAVKKMTG